jgi:hypothetical protein
MSTRFGVSASGNAGGAVNKTTPRKGLRWMNERQTEAYLLTREALRRVQRSFPSASPAHADDQATYGPSARMSQ